MKKLNPIEQTNYIEKEYKKYIYSTFQIKDKIYNKLFREKLKNEEIVKGPFLNIDLPFEKGKTLKELVEEGIVNKNFLKLSDINEERPLYKHQEEALRIIMDNRNAVVTTGTGSGKTECFLYPILNTILNQIQNGQGGPGIRAMFLYPMNALVNDQMQRIRKILANYPQITFGSFTGETPEEVTSSIRSKILKESEVGILPNEILSREEIRQNPPHLLFTNYSMLEHLLLRPKDEKIFNKESTKNWRFIVLDEAHTYNGALGIELGLLLRRVAGLANEKPNFILTSATLGKGKEDVDKIVNFANNLTSNKFNKDDVVFATRKYLDEKLIRYTVDSKIYSLLKENYDNIEKIKDIIKEYGDFNNYTKVNEILFDLLIKDKNIIDLYNIGKDVLEFKTILKKFEDKFSQQELVDFIFLINKANKDGQTIYETKYHTFIRNLNSALITLGENPKMELSNYNTIEDKKAFEIGLCSYCQEMFLIGQIKDGMLLQNSEVDISENYGDISVKDVEYFLIKDKINLDDIDEDNIEKLIPYTLCSKCGHITQNSNLNKELCKCDKKYQIQLYKIDKKGSKVKNNLQKCPCCNRNNTNKVGIIDSFNLNKDRATALISQILYKTISGEEVINKIKNSTLNIFGGITENKTIIKQIPKKLLAFSDSRQQASYFASFFEYTHNRFLRKRLIWEVLNENNHEPMEVKDLVIKLIEKIAINNENIFCSELTPSEEAWITVLKEILNVDASNSAEGLGIFNFELDDNKIEKAIENKINFKIINDSFKLSKEEFITVIKVLFETFRNSSAIKYYNLVDLSIKIKEEEFLYRSGNNNIVKKLEKKRKKGENRSSFMPMGSIENNVYSYVEKIFKTKKIKNISINDFLSSIFDICKDTLFFENENITVEEVYQMPVENYKVFSYKNHKYYRCSKCGNITPYNVENICTKRNCEGKLEEINPDEIFKDNYYRKEYINKDIEKINVKEHTAQLSKDIAKKYQNDFKNGKINILSCSTTFEMGVDIGGLENVFLRNVPPSPANYVQRAGRAGRRNDSSAFVLTFCSNSSHDYTYFSAPNKMIKGNIEPPKFKITNEKIILRHLTATSLGYLFKKYPEYFTNKMLFLKEGIDEYESILKSKPEDLKDYIDNKILDDYLLEKYGDYKWVDLIINEESPLKKAKSNIIEKVDELNDLEKIAIVEDNLTLANYYDKQIRKILDCKNVIEMLSENAIIPKYGFPVDVVNLKVYDNGEYSNKYDLSRDLSLAISEYAPDSEIIVDKEKLVSKYIVMPRDKNKITKYYYYKCPKCERLNLDIVKENLNKCKYCNTENLKKVNNYFIKPEMGFIGIKAKEVSKRLKPKKTYAGEFNYIGGGIKDAKEIEYNKDKNSIILESTKDDEIAILNTNRFYLCEKCGYSELNKKEINSIIFKKHKNINGFDCDNDKLFQISLGHKFKTDVLKIKINFLTDKSKALSALYAIIEGVREAFNIESNDINGIIANNKGIYDIILFDNVPGGAGHVKRLLNKEGMIKAFNLAYEKVNKNCCDENTSCYNCLRNYYNQRYHLYLTRKEAKEILNEIIKTIS